MSKLTTLEQLQMLATRAKGYSDKLNTAMNTRVSALEEVGAEKNVIVGIQVNNVDQTPDENRKVNIEIPAQAEYSVVKDADSGDYAAVYHLTKGGTNTGVAINIPKDMVVESGTVETNPEGKPAGTYLVLTLANKTNDKVYINVGTLVDIYTTGSGDNDMVKIAIDASAHTISATITDGSITLAKLTTEAQNTINGKVDKVTTAIEDHFVMFGANGAQKDGSHLLATDDEVMTMLTTVFGAEASGD